jgi:hypothetical protein
MLQTSNNFGPSPLRLHGANNFWPPVWQTPSVQQDSVGHVLNGASSAKHRALGQPQQEVRSGLQPVQTVLTGSPVLREGQLVSWDVHAWAGLMHIVTHDLKRGFGDQFNLRPKNGRIGRLRPTSEQNCHCGTIKLHTNNS